MRKNEAGQVVAFQAVSSTDGSAVTTGSPTVYITIDGGTQATGTNSAIHEGQGAWSYVPTQAETNGDHIVFTFTLSGCINQSVNVYPVVVNDYKADVSGVATQSSVDALNDLSAADVNAQVDIALSDYDAPTKAEMDAGFAALNDPTVQQIADAVWDEPLSSHILAGSAGIYLLDAGLVASKLDTALESDGASGWQYTALALENAPSGGSLTVQQIVDGVWDEASSAHTVAGSFGAYVDSTLSQIRTVVDDTSNDVTDIQSTLGGVPGVVLTSAQQDAIIDGVLDEALAGHTTAGSLGKAIADIEVDTNDLQTNQGSWATADLTDVQNTVDDTNADLEAFISTTTVNFNNLDTKITTVDGIVDAILIDTDELQSKLIPMLILDGSVYQWTVNSLENAPTGSGGGGGSAGLSRIAF